MSEKREKEKQEKEKQEKGDSDLLKREKRLELAQKAFYQKVKGFREQERKRSGIYDTLDRAGVKNASDLIDLLKSGKSTKEGEMDAEEMKKIIAGAVKEHINPLVKRVEGIEKDTKTVGSHFSNQLTKAKLADIIKAENVPLVKNYFERFPGEVIQDFLNRSEENISPKDYVVFLEKNLSERFGPAIEKPNDSGKGDEKDKEPKEDSPIKAENEGGESSPPVAEKEDKKPDVSKMSFNQKVKHVVNLTKKQEAEKEAEEKGNK